MMPVSYTNRRGKVYYIRACKTRTGKDGWSMTMKMGDSLAEATPEGYEIHENPHGQVFLRKRLVSLITPEDIQAVRAALARQPHLRPDDTILDLDKKSLTIFLLNREQVEGLGDLFRVLRPGWRPDEAFIASHGEYTAMMRLKLDDPGRRLFTLERYCFRGSIDDWIPLAFGQPLDSLADKFFPHLGNESFYELI